MHSFHYIWYFKKYKYACIYIYEMLYENSFCTHKDIPYTYVLCVIFFHLFYCYLPLKAVHFNMSK